jgi:hypothetical protein
LKKEAFMEFLVKPETDVSTEIESLIYANEYVPGTGGTGGGCGCNEIKDKR